MTFISILCVLLLEQVKPPPVGFLRTALSGYAAILERQSNGGERRHGLTAWMVGVAVPVLVVLALQLVLDQLHALPAFLLDVALLYLVMGFRQFSHFFTDIQLALRAGEIDQARQLLAEWRGQGAERLSSSDIARLAIEQGILESHRHVFAPLFWFIVLGPAGALLYRLSLGKLESWRRHLPPAAEGDHFAAVAEDMFRWVDWLPVRLTAVTFAIVGDFEDAVHCWRTQAGQWRDAASGILLSSGAGALGVRLGLPLPDDAGVDERPELGLGDDADIGHLQSAIGLVWRAMILSLLLLALLTVASWVGG